MRPAWRRQFCRELSQQLKLNLFNPKIFAACPIEQILTLGTSPQRDFRAPDVSGFGFATRVDCIPLRKTKVPCGIRYDYHNSNIILTR